jgi:hypothetical protein
MIRSFALTFAAVTLRIWLPLLSTIGVEFEPLVEQAAAARSRMKLGSPIVLVLQFLALALMTVGHYV